MKIQSFVFPDDICCKGLCYRRETEAMIYANMKHPVSLTMATGAVLSSDAYMNFFDKAAWRQYTQLTNISLVLKLQGKGIVELYEDDILTQQIPFQTVTSSAIRFDLDIKNGDNCFFKIQADEQTVLYQASYLADELGQPPAEVNLAALICTYKREKMLKENLQCLGRSLFFEKGSEYYGKMFLYVTDNASVLRKEDIIGEDTAFGNIADYLCLKQSENLGGSGGFTKCILEMRQNHEGFPTTHAIFMDDDILFIPETFYRLYALLAYIRPEYESEVVAGRMFRMDHKNIQYTASEIWNQGNIMHQGFQEDMCIQENFTTCNEERGEYSGWWFAAYPYSFTKDNLPLPFFLHCDDVEYGLRHKSCPIVLNGIQVWHNTYEYKSSKVISYYDYRNRMIVNAMYGLLPDKESFLSSWKEKITEKHIVQEYSEERMLILAMRDFLKGKRHFLRRNVQRENRNIIVAAIQSRVKLKDSILWRMAAARIRFFYKHIISTYRS